jgi:DNA-binding transcriptional MerR regulator
VTLAELADAVGAPPRQIRFMIAEGVLPPATKTGRGANGYGDEHLARARRYMTLHGLGMKPSAIKVLMAFDEAIPIFQEAGVEVRVDPSRGRDAFDVETIVDGVRRALEAYQSKEPK